MREVLIEFIHDISDSIFLQPMQSVRVSYKNRPFSKITITRRSTFEFNVKVVGDPNRGNSKVLARAHWLFS